MKHMLMTLTCALLCGACMGTEPQPAAQAGTVAAALQSPEAVYITEARPDTSARFYIYLCSASWCAPCRAIMPKVVEQYRAMYSAGQNGLMVIPIASDYSGAMMCRIYLDGILYTEMEATLQ